MSTPPPKKRAASKAPKPRRRKSMTAATDSSEPESADEIPTFEEALKDLESTVHSLETGELGLAESLERYEEGIQRLKQCYAQLEAAERRVELLRRVDEEGVVHTEPFGEEATDLGEKAAMRSRRRSSASSGRRDPSENPLASKPKRQPPIERDGQDGVDGLPGLF